ncbi:low-density lipoprotein receptor-related protein 6 [Achroia grisella]|uniref:low-density lipoprotein receptor-related protein 6 n=1 Tax=Achroia grisella TaxID=688607 RepID=UPI0027D2378A|nr:low-density lipoprotein receptor-related protein 6 [Achroia grisella]
MTKRRRILHADKIIQNVIYVFCLLMFLQLKGYYGVSSNPILLYSTESDIRLVNVQKLGRANAIIKDLKQGSAVDFIHHKSLICWCDQISELIQCMRYNETQPGEKMRIVSEGLITPTGIAIDWYTDKIYWTDGETNKIEVISIEHKYRKVLFWSEVDLARAIAVVPKEGLLFWTDWGEVPKIERSGMNGDPLTRKVIVKDNIFWPNGITIDYDKNLIYWVDAKLHFVDVVDFNGENRRKVVNGGLEYPYALTIFNDKLYWTDWKTWSIHSWDISTNGPIKDLIKSNPVPVDIKAYDGSRQLMPAVPHPCNINNGGCSHLCLLAPNPPGYECACPTGVKLKETSNTTCYNNPQMLLLVAQSWSISKISLDSPDFTPYTLPLKDLKKTQTVDFDPKTEYIYWADSMTKTISRARLDGSEQSVVIHNSGVIDNIAIDPLARNIYWTDPITDTITVARLDGSARKVLIHEELYDPRAIALHPTAGWMFWSDWNEKKPKIERANLDGSERMLVVSEKLTWPNGIALDTVNNKLYWGDGRTHKIEVSNMDGSDRREVHSSDILHIFGLTLLGDRLYWTDIQRRTLYRVNKNSGIERQTVVEQMANMMGVKAFKIGDSIGWNPCVADNGGCSHLCFNRPTDYVCSCPLGLELDNDRKTCIEPEAFLIYSRKNIIGHIGIEHENNDAVLPIKELKEVSALAVHVSDAKLYWSDSKTKTINRCSINGTNVEKILEWTGLVEGLAIDWSGHNIYWTDTALQRIEVARLDGSSRRTLIWQGLKKPKSITLDPKKGFMYWSDLGSKSIKRAAMDGSSAIVVIEQAGRVQALAIDHEHRALYWAAFEPPTVQYAFLNGTGRKTLVDDVSMPNALTLYGDRVFWGDWNTGLIESAKKTDGGDRRGLYKQLDYISDLKMFGRRGGGGGNQCGVDNGGCSHLCLPLPADYRCGCPAHYRLNRDNLTCSEPEEFLLFAQKNAIGRLLVANGECADAFIPLTGLKNVKAIEYDPISKHLFWMEEDFHSIRRVPISYSSTSAVSDASVVVPNILRPFHMVLDVLGRTLYWTCIDADSINATSITNSSSVGVVMRGEGMMPRHLAFHQTKRFLIWNDVGLGAIMRSNVDGTARTWLATAANATALALDQSSSTVYWAVNRQIYAVDLDSDSNKTRIIWQGGWVGTLAAYGGALYLVAGAGAAAGGGPGGSNERALMRVALHRREAPAAPVPHVARLMAALTVHKVAREHPCYGGRACGGAAAACGARGSCGCGVQCARAVCAPGHFRCGAAHEPHAPRPHCIPLDWKCDKQQDCPDGSDEDAECGECAGLRCADGACVGALRDCRAGAYCALAAMPEAFRCDDRLCLAEELVCDGHRHCEDGSDEVIGSCEFAQKSEGRGSSRQSSAFVVCGALAGAAGGAAGAWLALRRLRRRAAPPPAHTALTARTKLPATRARPLGASCTEASESLCERYPRPTANPPPSPATASGASLAASASRRRAYRHYRAMNRPPPPTPASTDACESEPEHSARAPPPSPAPCLY